MKALFAVAIGLALASSASAQNWVESGDAGDLPGTAQVPAGSGALLSIALVLYDGHGREGGQEIWSDTPFDVERAPDGAGAGDPTVASWNGGGFSSGAYRIVLTGVEYCGGPVPTIDSTWGKIKSTYK